MPTESGGREQTLEAVLEDAREAGFLGPGDVRNHIRHARALAEAIAGVPEHFLDLGSGGGVPGLVLALEWPEARGVLLDASTRRSTFAAEACDRLGLDSRLSARVGRAEDLARDPDLRGAFELVVARSFGAPAVTAECAVGFLRRAGRLVVTEPPVERENRWPPDGLAKLGFGHATVRRVGDAGVATMVLQADVDERWPRRSGIPTKRPLWESP